MKNLVFFATFLLMTIFTKAQLPPIMKCNAAGDVCKQFTKLDDAYNDAVNGDYIYLPGGTFDLNVPVKKEIHIIGAGFNASASAITGTTIISTDIVLDTGCDGSTFEGFYLPKRFVNNGIAVNNITISRLNLNQITGNGTIYTYNNTKVLQCVMSNNYQYFAYNGTSAPKGTGNLIYNCFSGQINSLKDSVVKNCIFNTSMNGILNNSEGVLLSNNILSGNNSLSGSVVSNSNNIQFYNNLVHENLKNIIGATYINNNVFYKTTDKIFNNSTVFSYSEANDYSLFSLGKNLGDDGRDIGIYGGAISWKLGSAPSNPHIFYKNIESTLDANGNLPFQIKVSAEK